MGKKLKNNFFQPKMSAGQLLQFSSKNHQFFKKFSEKTKFLDTRAKSRSQLWLFTKNMVFVRFPKKIGLIWEFFSKFSSIFRHLGGKISNVLKKYRISDFFFLESIVAPRDKSPPAFLQNIKTKKRMRGFLSSVNWSGEFFFSRNFSFFERHKINDEPSP